jgi:hypothetical protein
MASAKLTPLAKTLIAIIILGGTAAAAWHLGLKGLLSGDGPEETAKEGGDSKDGKSSDPKSAGGPLGTKANPLKVSIVSFHGYAPALVANGSNLKTQPGSAFDKEGVQIEFGAIPARRVRNDEYA